MEADLNIEAISTHEADIDLSPLEQTTGLIDWSAMESVAQAVAAEPDVWVDHLIERFDELQRADERAMADPASIAGNEYSPSSGLVLIPAVFGLAGPCLDRCWQEKVGHWLVRHSNAAHERDDDLISEVLAHVGERLGEGGLIAAEAAIREVGKEHPRKWRTGWYTFWAMAEAGAREAGPSDARDRLDDLAREQIDLAQREFDPDHFENAIWYLLHSDRPFVERNIDQWIADAKLDARRYGRATSPLLVELKEIRRYLQGVQRVIELYDRPSDFRKLMQALLNWLNQSPDDDGNKSPCFELPPGLHVDDDDEDWGPAEQMPRAPIAEPIVRDDPRVGRNDPCPCGSGKKYKKCCLA